MKMMCNRTCAQFSPNGKYLLAGSLDSSVRLWSVHAGKCVKSFSGIVNLKYCCFPTFIPIENEMYVVSGSEDGNVVLWDLNTQTIQGKHKVFEGPILALAVNPSRPLIAVASLQPELDIKIFRLNH